MELESKAQLKLPPDSYTGSRGLSSAVTSAVLSRLLYALCTTALLVPLTAAAEMRRDANQGTPRATPDSLSGTLCLSSQGKTVRLPAPAASIFVADPAIADYQAPSSTTIFVFGKKPGRTSLFALNENGEALAEFRVVVTQPVEDLRATLKAELGDYPIQVTYTARDAILSGTAPNAEIVDGARKITEQYLSAGALVVNTIQVAGSLQVNLSVRVAEVSRSAMKELGINLSASGQNGAFVFGLAVAKLAVAAQAVAAARPASESALAVRTSMPCSTHSPASTSPQSWLNRT
ncbi:Flp pilus assembly secretin CpaC [Bradyrhizobium sp. i1.8.4]